MTGWPCRDNTVAKHGEGLFTARRFSKYQHKKFFEVISARVLLVSEQQVVLQAYHIGSRHTQGTSLRGQDLYYLFESRHTATGNLKRS